MAAYNPSYNALSRRPVSKRKTVQHLGFTGNAGALHAAQVAGPPPRPIANGVVPKPFTPAGAAGANAAAKADAAAPYRAGLGFTVPNQQPHGYDPALDAQGQNESLGYLLAKQDYSRDWNQGQGGLGYGREFHDYGQRLSDMILQHGQASQDFNTQRAGISQSYQRLGERQTDAARAAGEGEGGALAQSFIKRAANQGQDQGKVNVAQFREGSNFLQNAGNATVDANGVFHAGSNGRLSQQFQRALDDAGQGQFRTDLQHTLFGQQLGAEKAYAGVVDPLPPGVRDVSKNPAVPQYVKTVTHNGVKWNVSPSGQLTPIGKPKAKAAPAKAKARPPASYNAMSGRRY